MPAEPRGWLSGNVLGKLRSDALGFRLGSIKAHVLNSGFLREG